MLETEIDSSKSIKALIEGPLFPVLPWMLGSILEDWEASEPTLWGLSFEEHCRVRARRVQFLAHWMVAINDSEWHHLYEPFIVFFKGIERFYSMNDDITRKGFTKVKHTRYWGRSLDEFKPSVEKLSERVIAFVNHFCRDGRIADRQMMRDLMSQYLQVFRNVGTVALHATQSNVLEREPWEKYMVDRNRVHGILRLDQRITNASKTIEGKLG
jgi:hypothetical protein